LIGSNEKAALELYNELFQNAKEKEGYFFKGFVTVNGENTVLMNDQDCQNLGQLCIASRD
jgi:hypothetical protein